MERLPRRGCGRVWARATVVILLASLSVSLSGAEETTAAVSLTQALAAALDGGPDAKIAELSLASARAQYEQATARNGLSLGASASAGHSGSVLAGGSPGSDSLQAALSFSIPQTLSSVNLSASHRISETTPVSQSTSVSLSVNQAIWDGYGSPLDGGKNAANLRQSEIALRLKELSARESRQTIISQVKQAYATLLSAQHAVTARQGARDRQQAQLARTQALVDNQLASSLDLKQAKINAQSAENDLAAAADSLVIARRKLSALLGWPADRQYEVADVPDPVAPGLDLEQLVVTAMEKRIDVQRQKLNEASAEISLALLEAQRSPTVNANASLGVEQNWTAATLGMPWSIGVSGSIPLFDAGLGAAQVREATLAREISRVQADQLATSIATEVANAVNALSNAQRQAALAADSLELAQGQYELAQARLGLGVGSTLDVLDALVSLTNAEIALSKAKGDVQLGILQLQDALGTIEE